MQMKGRYGFSTPTAEEMAALGLQPGTNAAAIHLNPEGNGEDAHGLIRYLKYVDEQLIFKIEDRINGEDWHYTISEPDDYRSEEAREEDAREMADQIEEVAGLKYLLGLEELIVSGGRIIDEKNFESGMLFCKVHVLDLEKQEIVQDFYTYNTNGFMVFTFTEGKDSQEQELITDLRNELIVDLIHHASIRSATTTNIMLCVAKNVS